MTDDERSHAKRLASNYKKWSPNQWAADGSVDVERVFADGYLLGRESMQDERDRFRESEIGQVLRNRVARLGWKEVYAELELSRDRWEKAAYANSDELKAERARSAKLIERLKLIRSMESVHGVWGRITSAIAEYEADA